MIKIKYDALDVLRKADLQNNLNTAETAVLYIIDIRDRDFAKKLSSVLFVSDFNSLEKEKKKIDEEVRFEIKTKEGIFSIPTYYELATLISLAIKDFLLNNGGRLLPNDIFYATYREACLAFKNISKKIYVKCKKAVYELSVKEETIRLAFKTY